MAGSRITARGRERSRRATGRAVIFHSLADARMAVEAAAALDTSVVLWTAPGTAAYAGAGWFAAVLEAVRSAQPEARFEAVLDCDDLPGHVLGPNGDQARRYCGSTESAPFATTAAACARSAHERRSRGRLPKLAFR